MARAFTKHKTFQQTNLMKNKYILIALLAAAIGIPAKQAGAQALYNDGATLNISTGTQLYIVGNFTNATGSTIANAGNLRVSGNIINNATMGSATGGTLTLEGSSAQTLGGTADYFATNVLVNNAAGVTLNSKLKVDGIATFTNGLINTASSTTPLLFTATGTATTASNASHVNGFVVKEGTGSFSYPVGDVSNYQKVDINLTANGTGMQVKYNPTDAGTGPFTSGGTEPTPLTSYNNLEHWDNTPLSTATGAVTVFWDGYKDAYTNPVAERKVAHKTGGNWLNEGTTGMGTTSAGSVTSNAISTWSPFTMGFVSSVLPVKWLNVNGSLTSNKQAVINFKVNENNVARYEIEKGSNGNGFAGIATLGSKGNGENNYQFTETTVLDGTKYYRIKQIDIDGRFGYSSIIKLSNDANKAISIYPNPVKDVVSISGATVGSKAYLVDAMGKVLQQIIISQTSFTLDMSKYNSGVYLLKTDNGATQKIIKE